MSRNVSIQVCTMPCSSAKCVLRAAAMAKRRSSARSARAEIGVVQIDMRAPVDGHQARRHRDIDVLTVPSSRHGTPAWSPIAVAAGDLRPGRDRGAAGQARHRRGHNNRVEEHGAAGLPTANQANRFADCRALSCRTQHMSGAPGAVSGLRRCCRKRYAEPSVAEGERRLGPFIRKWRLKCKAVADSLEEAGDRLFTYTRLPLNQWKTAHHQRDRTAP